MTDVELLDKHLPKPFAEYSASQRYQIRERLAIMVEESGFTPDKAARRIGTFVRRGFV